MIVCVSIAESIIYCLEGEASLRWKRNRNEVSKA